MSRTRTTGRDPRIPRTAPRRSSRAAGPTPGTVMSGSVATLDPGLAPQPDLATAPAAAGAPAASTESITPPAGPDGRSRRATRRPRSESRPRAPRHRLLLACTAILAAGLFGVLLLNTIISQGAFRQHELEIDLILLAEKEEALARAVQQAESPIEVEKRARALGMVPAAAPVFLRLSDGALLGEPVPAPEPTGPVDFVGAPGIQPTPSPGAASAGADPATGIDPALDPSTGLAPATTDPGTTDPAATDPAATDPGTTDPAASPAPTPSPAPTSSPGATPVPAPSTQQGVNP